MFQGTHYYTLDDKGRLKLPAEFAAALGASFVVTKGLGGPLWALPASEWDGMVERLRGDSIADQRALALQRLFIGSAATLSVDNQGRVILPQVLREHAQIDRDVAVVGTGPRVELWARARWDAYQQSLSDELVEELARSAGL